ncbi:hypothetical protein RAZWK3B_16635 [Roseobacter sp. AzwK-3b]|nr:hypothetical protein RAZWK3B_16635 [Roseobacter sp. AzwK-3b]
MERFLDNPETMQAADQVMLNQLCSKVYLVQKAAPTLTLQ